MNPKILIVDDEPDMVDLLRFNLTTHGYTVFTARYGLQALHQAQRHLPDLVVLDVMMEGIDGYTVCELLRSQPSTANTPIIMITAALGQFTRSNCLAAGADDFLNKPFRPQELLSRVETVLEAHQARMEALRAAQEAEAALEAIRPI